jgi:hypothetical protein
MNSPKFPFGLHHCDGLVEAIKMDISSAYIGARMREICSGHHAGPVGPTPGHMEMCWHVDAMCP